MTLSWLIGFFFPGGLPLSYFPSPFHPGHRPIHLLKPPSLLLLVTLAVGMAVGFVMPVPVCLRPCRDPEEWFEAQLLGGGGGPEAAHVLCPVTIQ